MRAAIYARVSTERQERQQTIGSQVSALRDWADNQGHALAEAHVFRDEGYQPVDKIGCRAQHHKMSGCKAHGWPSMLCCPRAGGILSTG